MKMDEMTFNIYFTSPIDTRSLNTFLNVFETKIPDSCKRLNLMMHSQGGQVRPAVALYHFLKSVPIPIVTYNIGAVDSAAILPYLGGTERFCTPNSRFLIHPVTKGFRDCEKSADELDAILEEVRTDIAAIADILVKNTLRPKKDWLEMIRKQTYVTAVEAVTLGIATVTANAAIPFFPVDKSLFAIV